MASGPFMVNGFTLCYKDGIAEHAPRKQLFSFVIIINNLLTNDVTDTSITSIPLVLATLLLNVITIASRLKPLGFGHH